MADPNILIPFIKSWEGGFANHPKDPGGATMKGITLATFRSVYGSARTVQDLKNMTDEQWHHIFKTLYWDRWKADNIKSQSLANLLVDWVWASGAHGITKVQQLLGVVSDGIVGPKTLTALNSKDSHTFFETVFNRRKRFIESCNGFATFGKGWLNRLNCIGYGWLQNNGSKYKTYFTP